MCPDVSGLKSLSKLSGKSVPPRGAPGDHREAAHAREGLQPGAETPRGAPPALGPRAADGTGRRGPGRGGSRGGSRRPVPAGSQGPDWPRARGFPGDDVRTQSAGESRARAPLLGSPGARGLPQRRPSPPPRPAAPPAVTPGSPGTARGHGVGAEGRGVPGERARPQLTLPVVEKTP